MSGRDLSEYQDPATTDYTTPDFFIIRTSHGQTEDRHWRTHFNNVVHAGKPLGFYHYLQHGNPTGEGAYFHQLTSFLLPAQVRFGWWVDVEEGQSDSDVNAFRSMARLFAVGLYSNLAGYNGALRSYMHFQLNWLAMPKGTVPPAGWQVPDHILLQDGIVAGVDNDVQVLAVQPYPAAWVLVGQEGVRF